MSFRPQSPLEDFVVLKEDRDDDASATQPSSDPAYVESSEDDGRPRITCRRVRKNIHEHVKSPSSRQHRSARDHSEYQNSTSPGSVTVNEHSVLRQPTKASSKSDSKRKQSGTNVAPSKAVMKNDFRAKQAVIREIEALWGRGFIKSYISKCHRPLTKRGNSKRSVFRKHDTDPINWLPSVLKAILMIAKLTDDKEWLKKAMNDVVRYRIKHTGNRKPQLVTTDFSVIEDMLVKDWKVPFSFEIRYKHILFQREDEEVADEDIDRIMDASSEDDGEDSDHDNDNDQDESDEQDNRVVKDVKAKHHRPSSSRKSRLHSSPTPSRRQPKQAKARSEVGKRSDSPPQTTGSSQPPGIHGFVKPTPGYGQFLDPWGRPMPAYWGPHMYNGHGAFGGYGGHGNYGPPPQFHSMQQEKQPPAHGLPFYPPPTYAMTPTSSVPESDYNQHRNGHKKRERQSPSVASKRARYTHTSSPSKSMQVNPETDPSHDDMIKHEPTADEDVNFDDEWAIPTKELEDDDHEDVDEDDVLDAEIEAMELELKLAQLKATRLRQRSKKKL